MRNYALPFTSSPEFGAESRFHCWPGLVTLWGIMDTHFNPYAAMISSHLIALYDHELAIAEHRSKNGDYSPNEGTRKNIALSADDLRRRCEETGARFAEQKCFELWFKVRHADLTAADIQGRLREVRETIIHEFLTIQFFPVPASGLKFARGEKIFGETVHDHFPSAQYDISEAGKCFALCRWTASVAHSMRVLECGLRALSTTLKVAFNQESWSTIINRCHAKIKKMEKRKRKPSKWKADRQFFSEALAVFDLLKDAWRNYAMHALDKYDEQRALGVLSQTERFMQHLGGRLSE